MLQLLVFMKLLLFGLLLEETFGNIEDEASKNEHSTIKNILRLTLLPGCSEKRNSVVCNMNIRQFIER